jgi:hypothetical protein
VTSCDVNKITKTSLCCLKTKPSSVNTEKVCQLYIYIIRRKSASQSRANQLLNDGRLLLRQLGRQTAQARLRSVPQRPGQGAPLHGRPLPPAAGHLPGRLGLHCRLRLSQRESGSADLSQQQCRLLLSINSSLSVDKVQSKAISLQELKSKNVV